MHFQILIYFAEELLGEIYYAHYAPYEMYIDEAVLDADKGDKGDLVLLLL